MSQAEIRNTVSSIIIFIMLIIFHDQPIYYSNNSFSHAKISWEDSKTITTKGTTKGIKIKEIITYCKVSVFTTPVFV